MDVDWKYPPGYEFAYAEVTTVVTIDPGGEPNDAIPTATQVYDGATVVVIEFVLRKDADKCPA